MNKGDDDLPMQVLFVLGFAFMGWVAGKTLKGRMIHEDDAVHGTEHRQQLVPPRTFPTPTRESHAAAPAKRSRRHPSRKTLTPSTMSPATVSPAITCSPTPSASSSGKHVANAESALRRRCVNPTRGVAARPAASSDRDLPREDDERRIPHKGRKREEEGGNVDHEGRATEVHTVTEEKISVFLAQLPDRESPEQKKASQKLLKKLRGIAHLEELGKSRALDDAQVQKITTKEDVEEKLRTLTIIPSHPPNFVSHSRDSPFSAQPAVRSSANSAARSSVTEGVPLTHRSEDRNSATAVLRVAIPMAPSASLPFKNPHASASCSPAASPPSLIASIAEISADSQLAAFHTPVALCSGANSASVTESKTQENSLTRASKPWTKFAGYWETEATTDHGTTAMWGTNGIAHWALAAPISAPSAKVGKETWDFTVPLSMNLDAAAAWSVAENVGKSAVTWNVTEAAVWENGNESTAWSATGAATWNAATDVDGSTAWSSATLNTEEGTMWNTAAVLYSDDNVTVNESWVAGEETPQQRAGVCNSGVNGSWTAHDEQTGEWDDSSYKSNAMSYAAPAQNTSSGSDYNEQDKSQYDHQTIRCPYVLPVYVKGIGMVFDRRVADEIYRHTPAYVLPQTQAHLRRPCATYSGARAFACTDYGADYWYPMHSRDYGASSNASPAKYEERRHARPANVFPIHRSNAVTTPVTPHAANRGYWVQGMYIPRNSYNDRKVHDAQKPNATDDNSVRPEMHKLDAADIDATSCVGRQPS